MVPSRASRTGSRALITLVSILLGVKTLGYCGLAYATIGTLAALIVAGAYLPYLRIVIFPPGSILGGSI